jgi:hypothetical protein
MIASMKRGQIRVVVRIQQTQYRLVMATLHIQFGPILATIHLQHQLIITTTCTQCGFIFPNIRGQHVQHVLILEYINFPPTFVGKT